MEGFDVIYENELNQDIKRGRSYGEYVLWRVRS